MPFDLFEVAGKIGDAPFKVLMLIAIYYGVRQLAQMKRSMEKLHVSLAVIVERVGSHEKRISSLERKRSK